MPPRRNIRVRVTTLDDPAGANGLWGPSTPEQRLQMLDEVSRAVWALTRRPTPTYARFDIPVRVYRRRAGSSDGPAGDDR